MTTEKVTNNNTSSSGIPPSNETVTSVVTPELQSAIENWVGYGFPHFLEMMNKLHDSKIISDPMIHTLVFNVFGGYLVNLSVEYNLTEDIEKSNSYAFNELMNDPSLASMANSFMKNAVNDQISKVID